jgi:hypothetical protein
MRRWLADVFAEYRRHPLPASVLAFIAAAGLVVAAVTWYSRLEGSTAPAPSPVVTVSQPAPFPAPLPSGLSSYTGPISPRPSFDPFGSTGNAPSASRTASSIRTPRDTRSARSSVSPRTTAPSRTPAPAPAPTPDPTPDPTPTAIGNSS